MFARSRRNSVSSSSHLMSNGGSGNYFSAGYPVYDEKSGDQYKSVVKELESGKM